MVSKTIDECSIHSSPAMSLKFEFKRKEGWDLNPKDSVVSNLVYMCLNNEGLCPYGNKCFDGTPKTCPCSDYLDHDVCIAKLYIKNNEKSKIN